MKRLLPYAFLLICLALIQGCARGPSGRAQAQTLRDWLGNQSCSTFETFKHKGKTPEHPPSPDGLTLGSPNVFAAIGAHPDDLTSLDIFWGDNRTVRPLAKPLTLSLNARGRGLPRGRKPGPIALKQFPDQTLRRLRHTSIAVSESSHLGLRLTCVDFAPMAPEDNFLARWFLIENTGSATRSVTLVLNLTAPGDWRRLDSRSFQLGERLAIVSSSKLRQRPDQLELRLGRVRPGRLATSAILLVAADPQHLSPHIEQARAALPQLPDLLEATRKNWEEWCAATPLQTGDTRMDDLLDSLLCLVRSHIGTNAIHTGSLRYPHNRAWIRDSYWVQRALLTLGRKEEAQRNLDFFHRAWQTSGIASYYEIPSCSSTAYGYHGVELPHYLVLMVRDADQLAGLDGAACWDMVKGCLDEAAVPPDGLQPMNGDESWLLAAPVRELDGLLDNSWLLIASAEYGADLAARMGDVARAARYKAIAAKGRAALDRFLPQPGQADWYSVGCGADGSRDYSLSPEVLARGAVFGALPATDPRLTAGLLAGWQRLGFERGIRTHARSATLTGGSPGYVLYAAADSPDCTFVPELARRTLDFAAATGCVWEYHDMYDPAWGGERSRLWDSAVLLLGLVHDLFEIERSDGGWSFIPRRTAHAPSAQPASPFPAGKLLSRSGPALLLQSRSPGHAARIARELLRHRNRRFAIADYPGQPPQQASAIIISPSQPPDGWTRTSRGYWIRQWAGPPQLWVRNNGHVYHDTDPLLTDLLSLLPPVRQTPLPFPDANYDLAARFGEPPAGEAELTAVSLFRRDAGRLDLSGGEHIIKLGAVTLTAKAAPDPARRLLKLTVSAAAPRPTPSELSVTLPAGWWLLYARDMTGRWDRVRDPVGQYELPDGRLRLVYSLRPGDQRLDFTFDLARLALSPS